MQRAAWLIPGSYSGGLEQQPRDSGVPWTVPSVQHQTRQFGGPTHLCPVSKVAVPAIGFRHSELCAEGSSDTPIAKSPDASLRASRTGQAQGLPARCTRCHPQLLEQVPSNQVHSDSQRPAGGGLGWQGFHSSLVASLAATDPRLLPSPGTPRRPHLLTVRGAFPPMLP